MLCLYVCVCVCVCVLAVLFPAVVLPVRPCRAMLGGMGGVGLHRVGARASHLLSVLHVCPCGFMCVCVRACRFVPGFGTNLHQFWNRWDLHVGAPASTGAHFSNKKKTWDVNPKTSMLGLRNDFGWKKGGQKLDSKRMRPKRGCPGWEDPWTYECSGTGNLVMYACLHLNRM